MHEQFKKESDVMQSIFSDKSADLSRYCEDYLWVMKIACITYKYFNSIPKEKLFEKETVQCAYVLFTRILSLSKNIRETIIIGQKENHWDYNLLFMVIRSMIETVEMLFYLCLENVTEDTKNFRIMCMRLHEYNDLINTLETSLNIKRISLEDPNYLLYLFNKFKKEKEDLLSKIARNSIYNSYKDYWDDINNGVYKYFFPKKNQKLSNRQLIEREMRINTKPIYDLIYFSLSLGVHPYHMSTDPELISLSSSHEIKLNIVHTYIISALTHGIKYLGYTTAKIINNFLLTEIKDLLDNNDLTKIKSLLSELQDKLDLTPIAD